MYINYLFKKLVLPIYIIAIISYLLSLYRDYLVIKHFENFNDFFLILYACSLATLSIKTIIFMDKETTKIKYKNIFFHFAFTSMILFFLNVGLEYTVKIEHFLLSLMWIIGSYIQRSLLLSKKIILSKSRDLLNTGFIILMTTISIYILKTKYNIILILILANIFSLIFLFVINLKYKIDDVTKLKFNKWYYIEKLKNLFLTSVGFVIFYIWAIIETNSSLQIFGYDKSLLVRVSFYFFAFFQIGSLILKFLPKNNFIAYMGIVFSLLFFLIYYIFLPKEFDIVVFPLGCVIIDFSALLLTNKNRKPLYNVD